MMIRIAFAFFCINLLAVAASNDIKIVGGADTAIAFYPYQLSLEYMGRHSCGAALVAPSWALTAAHCVAGAPAPLLAVRAGSSVRERGGLVVGVAATRAHDRFSAATLDYDVAALRLRQPVDAEYAEAVPLPPEGAAPARAGAPAIVTGWGAEEEGGRPARVLRVVEVPVVGRRECRKALPGATITERMLCAGAPDGGRDACQGDSGGPVLVDGLLAGVVSWGYGCARPALPGVYTDVAAVRDFIKNVTGI